LSFEPKAHSLTKQCQYLLRYPIRLVQHGVTQLQQDLDSGKCHLVFRHDLLWNFMTHGDDHAEKCQQANAAIYSPSPEYPAAGMISLRQGLLLDRDGETTAPSCPAEVLTKAEAHRASVLVRRQRLWPTVSAGLLRHSSQKGYEGRVTLATEDGKAGLTAPSCPAEVLTKAEAHRAQAGWLRRNSA